MSEKGMWIAGLLTMGVVTAVLAHAVWVPK